MSTVKVGAIRGVSASSDAITVANDGTCTANITNNLSNRNLIINGAMQVAQRNTSSGSSGYQTVDRFTFNGSGLNASVTTSQADVASGTTPYTLGFRKSHKIVNGAQTGPDAGDHIYFSQKMEAQNIANSGWNYLSTSSFITLSFWVKSSVAQNFYGYLISKDGSSYLYPFETGSLSANTWTKVTKTIPGNSNLTFDNDNGSGFELVIAPFFGTSKTGSVSLNAWGAYNSSVRVPNMTSTWFTTSGATFEYTGVQLEVGSVATDFEHRSFAQELQLCKRYYQKSYEYSTVPGTASSPLSMVIGRYPDTVTNRVDLSTRFQIEMRATPTLTFYRPFSGDAGQIENFGSGDGTAAGNGRTASVVNLGVNGHGGFVLDAGTQNVLGYHYQVDAEL